MENKLTDRKKKGEKHADEFKIIAQITKEMIDKTNRQDKKTREKKIKEMSLSQG